MSRNFTLLRRYLEARETDAWGWRDRYEVEMFEPLEKNWPALAGHYCGLLEDALSLIHSAFLESVMAAVMDKPDEEWRP